MDQQVEISNDVFEKIIDLKGILSKFEKVIQEKSKEDVEEAPSVPRLIPRRCISN